MGAASPAANVFGESPSYLAVCYWGLCWIQRHNWICQTSGTTVGRIIIYSAHIAESLVAFRAANAYKKRHGKELFHRCNLDERCS